MAKNRCCICGGDVETKTAAILTLGRSAYPRLLCPECERRIDTAGIAGTYEEVAEACRELGDAMTAYNVEDVSVINTVNDIISASMERAKAIREGTYDFSQDEPADNSAEERTEPTEDGEEEFDLPEELRETAEDRELDKKDARSNKIFDTVTGWLAGAILVGALVFFLIRFVF